MWNILNLVKIKKKRYVIYFEKYDEACFRYETYAQIFWLANPTADVYFFFQIENTPCTWQSKN